MNDEINFGALKSGSDIRGYASECLGHKVNLTNEAAYECGAAFVRYLMKRGESDISIAVGRDCRITSESLAKAFMGGAAHMGARCLYVGEAMTPAMFMCLKGEEHISASAMITASHLPKDRNGIKLFLPEGGLSGADITEILSLCTQDITACEGEYVQWDYMKRYAADMREMMGGDGALRGMKIAVDAGNGMGGMFARDILGRLGADISGSVNLDCNGEFPVHIPNPEDKAAMDCAARAVLQSASDIGVVLDTDCDRAAIVDREGREINRNRLIALVAAMTCRSEKNPVIVTDSVTSRGLTSFIKSVGGIHRRYKRGYNNVIGEAKRLNAPVAIETSGHCALRENYYLDDGAYLALRLIGLCAKLKAEGEDISSLISALPECLEEKELRFTVNCEDFRAYGQEVIDAVKAAAEHVEGWEAESDNSEGIRINTKPLYGDGWLLLRQSVHDPVLPLNLEADETGGCRKMAQALRDILGGFDKLDITSLVDYIG